MVNARTVCFCAVLAMFAFVPLSFAQDAPPKAAASGEQALPLPKKVTVEQMLQRETTLDFVETPLRDVAAFLQEAHGVPVLLNVKALESLNITPDSPVTSNLKGVRLETALGIITRQLDLTYDVSDELIQITTEDDLVSHPQARLYDCRDLLALGPNGIPATAGNELVKVETPADAEALKQTIMRCVEPQTWENTNGTGTVENFKGMLIINHTSQTHRKVEKLLNTIRETAGLEARLAKTIK